MWKFRNMARGEENAQPIQQEFFSTDELGDLSDVFVREIVQNSLDARKGSEQVKVAFRVGFVDSEQATRFQDFFFDGLWPHLKAPNNGLYPAPDNSGGFLYLAVEDFGTKGLRGDPEFDDHDEALPEDQQDDFFYFWRNIGRNAKDTESLGSWGLGKQVLHAASSINCFFGLTKVENSDVASLMGKCILKIHHVRGQKYSPYGYFGRFNQEQPDFSLPYQDSKTVHEFSNIFELNREEDPGLSLVIPLAHPELTDQKRLLKSVASQYYYPILKGDLVAEVTYRDETIDLHRENFRERVTELFPADSDLRALIDTFCWITTYPENGFYPAIDGLDLYKEPTWKSFLTGDEEEVRNIRSAFREEGRVAVNVPVRVWKQSEDVPRRGSFNVFLIYQEDQDRRSPIFVRQGIEISNANNALMNKGLMGVVEITDPNLSEFLRICEPPAHDKWEMRNNEKLKQHYQAGVRTAGFVKNAVHELYRILSIGMDQRDPDLLRDLFFVKLDSKEKVGTTGAGKKKKARKKDQTDIQVRPPAPMVRTEKWSSDGGAGFRITNAAEADAPPVGLEIRVAYMVPTGSPLKNYSCYDFRLDTEPMLVEYDNMDITRIEENVIRAENLELPFALRVTGFDTNRDIFVKVQPERGENDPEV